MKHSPTRWSTILNNFIKAKISKMGYGHKVNDFVQEITCSTIITTQKPIKNWNAGFGRDTEYLHCA